MTKIAKCYGKIFVFSNLLCFRQIQACRIVQNHDIKRQNPHHSYNCYDAGFFTYKGFSNCLNRICN